MARSLNSVQLIGNLTRDPEMRYTASGTAVCTIGLATNRQWKTETGEKKEDTEFHRIVVWNKLAEICAQYLKKGRKAYFHGRLSTQQWTAQDGTQKTTTEIIADDMIILSSERDGAISSLSQNPQEESVANLPDTHPEKTTQSKEPTTETKAEEITNPTPAEKTVNPDEIPF